MHFLTLAVVLRSQAASKALQGVSATKSEPLQPEELLRDTWHAHFMSKGIPID